MTKFQALFVKLLRVRYGFSWRAVHRDWQVRYVPKEEWWYNSALDGLRGIMNAKMDLPLDNPDGNQICGIELCNEAMKLLGEKVEDGWN